MTHFIDSMFYVQAKQLDIASDLTVTASENVTSGNEQIRQVSTTLIYKISSSLLILFSTGNQEQSKPETMDFVYFNHVLFLLTLSSLVQLIADPIYEL